jgi:hypothetical protein
MHGLGDVILGQNEISHPAPTQPWPPAGASRRPAPPRPRRCPNSSRSYLTDCVTQSPTRIGKRNRNLFVDKSSSSLNLHSPIAKVYYVNSDGNGLCWCGTAGLSATHRSISLPPPPTHTHTLSLSLCVRVCGPEILPQVNERVLETVARRRTVVYSCGSFYTSILPCLIVAGAHVSATVRPCRHPNLSSVAMAQGSGVRWRRCRACPK